MNNDKLLEIAQRLAPKSGNTRTAGVVEFRKDVGPVRRDIRVEGFEWSPESLRSLAKILWAAQRSHSYAISALRMFSKTPSSQISPDGLLGGRGYIQQIKDMRTVLAQSIEGLSSFSDTLHDEINAAHWKDANAESGPIQEIVQDAESVKANPEEFVEDQYDAAAIEGDWNTEDGEFDDSQNPTPDEEEEPLANPDPDEYNPEFEEEEEDDEENEYGFNQQAGSFSDAEDLKAIVSPKSDKNKPGPSLPTDTSDQKQGKSEVESVMNTTTLDHGSYSSSIAIIMNRGVERTAASHISDSSVDPGSLPGPRIEHVGPGASETGFWGDGYGSDDPAGEDLSSGVNVTDPIYEDWCADGVTGYDNVTDGDTSVLKISSSYSWLPGANNDLNMNYYERGLSAADMDWMRDNASPPMPPGIFAPKEKIDQSSLWEVDF